MNKKNNIASLLNSVQTNGQKKCPSCGATDITFDDKTGKFICFYCKNEIIGEKIDNTHIDINTLKERIISPGAANIKECDSLVTLRCSSCGSEITIDSENKHYTKCHWCRNTLVLDNLLQNGTIPDIIIPFSVNKDTAYDSMVEFLQRRKNFAKKDFKKHFKKENVVGVYFPYMVLNMNGHVFLKGEGEATTIRYKKNISGAYDAKLYSIERECDFIISDFIIESDLSKLYNHNNDTVNIINSILPYDITKAVKWDARYIQEHNIEKRNGNIIDIRPSIYSHVKSILHHTSNDWVKRYTRGVRWDENKIDIQGEHWQAAYLPVWLYTFNDSNGEEETLHYIAVNGQTGETMGSVPYSRKTARLAHTLQLLITLTVTIIFPPLLCITMFIFLVFILAFPNSESLYRNEYAHHDYENETSIKIINMKEHDTHIKDLIGINNQYMQDSNHHYYN